MNKFTFKEAQALIQSICTAAADEEYDTREKFLAMLEANPDVAAQGYNAFGKIFFWNKASVILYGYSEDEAVNKDLFETILPPELRPFARNMVLSATETGAMPDASSCDLIHSSGEYVTVFSGHLMFRWENPATPEFYCVDVGIAPQLP